MCMLFIERLWRNAAVKLWESLLRRVVVGNNPYLFFYIWSFFIV